jgi:hypothetical protein
VCSFIIFKVSINWGNPGDISASRGYLHTTTLRVAFVSLALEYNCREQFPKKQTQTA